MNHSESLCGRQRKKKKGGGGCVDGYGLRFIVNVY